MVLAEGKVLAEGEPRDVLRPEILDRAFGMAADIFDGPDGRPVVVARLAGDRVRRRVPPDYSGPDC